MTDSTITVTITVPDDMSEELGGLGVMVESVGVSESRLPLLMLAATEVVMRSDIEQDLARANPMQTGDVVEAMAVLNARLALIDAACHLPQATVNGVRFDLDLPPE